VSGTGAITAAGDGVAPVVARMRAGAPLARTVERGVPCAGIAGFDGSRYVERKGLRHLSRTSQLACAAASLVAPTLSGVSPERVGVVLGSAWATLDAIVRFEREAHVEGPRFVDPGLFAETVPNVPAGQVSIFFGWSAFNATVTSGTASGLVAVERAIEILEDGRGDVAVAGAADELSLHALGALAAGGACPAGFVAGEGACLLALESAEHVRSRGASALGRVRIAGSHWSRETPAHARWLAALLDRARVAPASVDLVVRSGDERRVDPILREVLDPGAPRRSESTAVLGETWAAAGPLGIAIALEAFAQAGGRPVREALVVDASAEGHVAAVLLSAAA
jgi:3-oxoacyl-[acyl-carrier-protein] synthase II